MCQESGGILLLHEQPVQGRGGFNATSFQCISMPHPLPKTGISAQIVEDFVKVCWLNLVELGVDPSDSRFVLCLWVCVSVYL